MLKNYASGNFFSINTVTQLRTIIKALNLGILHYMQSLQYGGFRTPIPSLFNVNR